MSCVGGARFLLLVLILAVAAPAAALGPAPDAGAEAPEEPLLAKAGAALSEAGAAVAEGTAGAADAVGSGVAATFSALAEGLAAVGAGIAWAAASAVDGLAALWSGLVYGLLAIGDAIAGAGAALWSGLLALLTLLGSLAGLVGDLFQRVPPEARPYALAGAGATGASMLGYALWRRLLGGAGAAALYSRIGRGEVLDNEARARVYEHIRANPGAHVTAIAEALDLGWGTTVYHLGKLKSHGLVVEKRGGNHKCFFVNGGLSQGEQRAVAALKHDKARDILDYLRAHPAATQKDVAAALGMSAALVSWHVQRLVEAGVLSKTREGKGTSLRVLTEAAAPEPIPA